jgi:hypothetical protein
MNRTLGVLALVGIGCAHGADKSQYHLLNPTPREFMRELATDRPDKTESAYTVDAGHFQIEMDVLTYAYDRYNGLPGDTSIEKVAIAPINLKVGLCNNVDLQLVVLSYNVVRVHNRATREVTENRGFGDVIPRLKVNLWGNDSGPTAFALMPFVKLPTNQDHLGNNSVEGGIIAPFAVSLPADFDLGLMTQVNLIRDEPGSGYHPDFVNTITLSHALFGELSAFIEFYSSVSTESGSEWVGTFDVGFTYLLTENIQLDAGVYLGLTRSADDVNPFVGLSWRF